MSPCARTVAAPSSTAAPRPGARGSRPPRARAPTGAGCARPGHEVGPDVRGRQPCAARRTGRDPSAGARARAGRPAPSPPSGRARVDGLARDGRGLDPAVHAHGRGPGAVGPRHLGTHPPSGAGTGAGAAIPAAIAACSTRQPSASQSSQRGSPQALSAASSACGCLGGSRCDRLPSFAGALVLILAAIGTSVVNEATTATKRVNTYVTKVDGRTGKTAADHDVDRLQAWLDHHGLKRVDVQTRGTSWSSGCASATSRATPTGSSTSWRAPPCRSPSC